MEGGSFGDFEKKAEFMIVHKGGGGGGALEIAFGQGTSGGGRYPIPFC